MTAHPIDTSGKRSIMQPKKESKARKMADAWGSIDRAEQEIEHWTKVKLNAEMEINAEENSRTESVHEGSGSKEGCEGVSEEDRS